MRLHRPVVLMLFVAAVLAGPAQASTLPANCRTVSGTGADAKNVCEERVYYECIGANKVQNVEILQGRTPTWTKTAPTTSFSAGGGCGTADSALTNTGTPSNGHDGVWAGTFKGNLDSLTMEFHEIDSTSRIDNRKSLLLWVQVEGADRIPRTTTATIQVIGTRSSTGLSIKYEVTLTDLELVNEIGSGDAERDIMISIRNNADYPGAWVWGATEVPSGITFNPKTPAAYKVKAAPAA